MIKISCIVPVYNLENKVSKCIESILNQTLKEIEILLVNDCSTDNSLKVLKEYEALYSNIKVINLEKNCRQGGARNRGLEVAKGEYICFVDGDDWIESDMFEVLYKYANEHGCDIVDSDYYQEDIDGTLETRISIPSNKFWNLKEDKILHTGRIWTKIIKRSLLIDNNIKFIEHKKFEDNPYLPIVFLYAKKIGKVERCFYHYIYNQNSTSRKKNDYSIFDRLETAEFLITETKKRGFYDKYQKEIEFLFIQLYFTNTVVSCIIGFDVPQYSYIKKVYQGINQKIPLYRKNEYIKMSSKYIKLLTKCNLPALYIFASCINIFDKIGLRKKIVKVGKS